MTEAGPLPLVLVAAVARNGVIGGKNRLLWRLSSDLKHFRTITWGKPLLMGRRTFASIGRPLPGRETIVLTRAVDFHAEGVLVAHDLDAAVALATRRGRAMGAAEIIVAGGGDLYAQLIGRAARLAITEVDLAPAGDAYFPKIDPALWREIGRLPHPAGPGDEAAFAFVDYAPMC
jgi:dihydrofolate reductase